MKYSKLLSILAFALLFACTSDDLITENEETETDGLNRELVTDKALLAGIASLDLDVGEVTVGDYHLPNGKIEQRIYIGHDIAMTKAELQALIDANSSVAKQFRTYNLVSPPNQTIDILGWTEAPFALSAKAQNALTMAVANYNSLNTTLQFDLRFGNDLTAEMIIFDNSVNNPNSGGVAGFPTASGLPHDLIQIYGLESFSLDVNEHVITHEIGHSIGFRHTDWFDRLSCGGGVVYEGVGGVGAAHIPGTPTGRDFTSIMQSCFNLSVSGEFNANDITALEYMYPIGGSTSPCDGVPAWQSGVTYSVGDQVTYFGNLFEFTASGWVFISIC